MTTEAAYREQQHTNRTLDMVAEMSALQLRVQALEEALRPFATACDVLGDNPPSPDVQVATYYGERDIVCPECGDGFKTVPDLGHKVAHLVWQDLTRAKALLEVSRG